MQKYRESLKESLSTIQRECQESNETIAEKLSKIRRGQQREQLLVDNVNFTTKTLSEFDDIDPPVLDIIFGP